jgi:hypothetical protein
MCALTTLDVENAFNMVPWEGIAEALEGDAISPELGMVIASYLEKRQLMVNDDMTVAVTCAVYGTL